MIEDDFIDRDLTLDNPVQAFRQVSRDLACRVPLRMRDGRTMTAIDIQREFLELAHRYYRDRGARHGDQGRPGRAGSTCSTGSPQDPMSALPRARLGDQERSDRELHGSATSVDWTDSQVAMIDLQYHDIRPGQGPVLPLEQSDAVERIVERRRDRARDPRRRRSDTRAYFRGMCLQRYRRTSSRRRGIR